MGRERLGGGMHRGHVGGLWASALRKLRGRHLCRGGGRCELHAVLGGGIPDGDRRGELPALRGGPRVGGDRRFGPRDVRAMRSGHLRERARGPLQQLLCGKM